MNFISDLFIEITIDFKINKIGKIAFKIDYSFPTGFHPVGKNLIESIFLQSPKSRLGADREHDQIKSHNFFNDINWENLDLQTPPEIKQYFQVKIMI